MGLWGLLALLVAPPLATLVAALVSRRFRTVTLVAIAAIAIVWGGTFLASTISPSSTEGSEEIWTATESAIVVSFLVPIHLALSLLAGLMPWVALSPRRRTPDAGAPM